MARYAFAHDAGDPDQDVSASILDDLIAPPMRAWGKAV
jgi:hypothetical protein